MVFAGSEELLSQALTDAIRSNLRFIQQDNMNVRTVIGNTLKVSALTIIYFICFVIATALMPLDTGVQQSQADQANAALILIAVCLLNTVVLAYIILCSRWWGWKLIGAMFLIIYGVVTVMPQSESAFFLTRLPAGMVPRLFASGAIVAILFSSVAVLILGKRKRNAVDGDANQILVSGTSQWIWKLAVSVVLYVILYFSFGYFIAWKNPALRAYYGGTDPGSLITQLHSVLSNTPWLMPFQILRGLAWTGLGLLTISMMRGQWWKVALAVGALFGVVMCSWLLLPNPFMPEAVRMTHLVETASSNFIFGFVLVCLFHRQSSSTHRPMSHTANSGL